MAWNGENEGNMGTYGIVGGSTNVPSINMGNNNPYNFGGFDFDWSDFTPTQSSSGSGSSTGSGSSQGSSSGSSSSSQSSYSGVPTWFTESNNLNDLWKQVNDFRHGAWYNANTNPTVNPAVAALIEQQRQLMPQQYANEMQQFYQRQINPMANSMSNRGVLNSSITGDALTRILREQMGKQADQVTQANVWSGNALLKDIGDQRGMNFQAWQQAMQFLPTLLAALRESTSQGQSQSEQQSNQSSVFNNQSDWSNESEGSGTPYFPGFE